MLETRESTREDSGKYRIALPGAANCAIHLHTMTMELSATVYAASRRIVIVVVLVVVVVVAVVVMLVVVTEPCLHWHSLPWSNRGSPKTPFEHSILPSTCFDMDQLPAYP